MKGASKIANGTLKNENKNKNKKPRCYQISIFRFPIFLLWFAGPLFTKRQDALPPNFVKSRSRAIGCYSDRIALKFDRYLGSAAAEMLVKFQSDWKILNPNLAAPRFRKILR